ncbi:hypothetical protein Taro_004248 [Colocasia esculenta]|uniref:Uncharacterized protein n=1 Tax=Colocasia esculenta TaxID=4460 RepID=A0A843TJK2_COLES|nr:hypothetical protein [Colocasia esculenta]
MHHHLLQQGMPIPFARWVMELRMSRDGEGCQNLQLRRRHSRQNWCYWLQWDWAWELGGVLYASETLGLIINRPLVKPGQKSGGHDTLGQVCIWIYLWIDDNDIVEFLGQVGSVTAICFTCFLVRCVVSTAALGEEVSTCSDWLCPLHTYPSSLRLGLLHLAARNSSSCS